LVRAHRPQATNQCTFVNQDKISYKKTLIATDNREMEITTDHQYILCYFQKQVNLTSAQLAFRQSLPE
jgi:hypothetical protein